MTKPKYMNNLHVTVSAITGTPRIVKIKEHDQRKNYVITENYIDIPKNEWDSALIQYFRAFDINVRQLVVGKSDWSFFAGGHFETPEKLIQCLKGCISEIEKLTKEESKNGTEM
jgi:hypothetical protein